MSAMSRIDREKKAHELFTRFDGNPILKAETGLTPPTRSSTRRRGWTPDAGWVPRSKTCGVFSLTVARSPNGRRTGRGPEPTRPPTNQRTGTWGWKPAHRLAPGAKQFAVTYVSSARRTIVSLAIQRTSARLPSGRPAASGRQGRILFLVGLTGGSADSPARAGRSAHLDQLLAGPEHWGDHHSCAAYWDCHRVGLACSRRDTGGGDLLPRVRSNTAGHDLCTGLACWTGNGWYS